jgi:hypothetical protein
VVKYKKSFDKRKRDKIMKSPVKLLSFVFVLFTIMLFAFPDSVVVKLLWIMVALVLFIDYYGKQLFSWLARLIKGETSIRVGDHEYTYVSEWPIRLKLGQYINSARSVGVTYTFAVFRFGVFHWGDTSISIKHSKNHGVVEYAHLEPAGIVLDVPEIMPPGKYRVYLKQGVGGGRPHLTFEQI